MIISFKQKKNFIIIYYLIARGGGRVQNEVATKLNIDVYVTVLTVCLAPHKLRNIITISTHSKCLKLTIKNFKWIVPKGFQFYN